MNSRAYYDLLAEDHEQENQFWDNPYDNEVWAGGASFGFQGCGFFFDA
jgi:hypothetical protein